MRPSIIVIYLFLFIGALLGLATPVVGTIATGPYSVCAPICLDPLATCDPPSAEGGFSSFLALTNCAGQQEDGAYNEWKGQVYNAAGLTWASFNFYVIAPNGSIAWQVGALFPIDPPVPVTDQGSFTTTVATVPEPSMIIPCCSGYVW
jgi:hypothetical protein